MSTMRPLEVCNHLLVESQCLIAWYGEVEGDHVLLAEFGHFEWKCFESKCFGENGFSV